MVKKLKEIKEDIERKEREKKADELLGKVEELEKKVQFPTEFRLAIVRSVEWVFNAIANRKGEHWKLDPDELQALGDSYIALGEKYLPEGLSRFSVEINALLWTAIILSKRVLFK